MSNDNRTTAGLAGLVAAYRARNDAHARTLAAPLPRVGSLEDDGDPTVTIPRMTRIELARSGVRS